MKQFRNWNLKFLLIPILLLIIGGVTVSLSPVKKYERKDYMDWYTQNKSSLARNHQNEGWTFDLQYEPCEVILLRQSENDLNHLEQGLEDEKFFHHFKLAFDYRGQSAFSQAKADYQLLGEMVHYFTKDAKNDFFLIENQKDTLPCVLFHLERYYDLQPFDIVNMSFERNSDGPSGDLVLHFKDRLVGIGDTQFSFKKKTINNIPELKL